MKQCRDCHEQKEEVLFVKNKSFSSGYDTLCSSCNKKRVSKWRKEFPEKRAKQSQREGKKDYSKNKHLKYHYGISLDEYNKMFHQQEGKCYLCGKHQSEVKRALSVDHCHKTGKIRKLLCQPCNTLLGMSGDDPIVLQKAIDYLMENK